MRHKSNKRILSRSRKGRSALLRGLAVSLINRGKIKTTVAKAKELRPFAERLVTYGKKATLSSRRIATSVLGEPNNKVVKKLFEEIAPKFKERHGGYTRVVKMGRTASGKDEAMIEFIE